jgi:hypothetical protein
MTGLRVWTIFLLLLVSGCAHHQKIPPENIHAVYLGDGMEGTLLKRYAPAFLTLDYQSTYNRIGKPSARYDEEGQEIIYIDPARPVIYTMEREFSTAKGAYTNLIYRVHFSKVPFSIIPFYLTSGYNVGIIVIITLDAEKKPVLLSTVGTCGCYLAIVPTTYLPSDALPRDWQEKPLEVYGEELPWVLDYTEKESPKVLVHLRPGVHRIMDLEIVAGEELPGARPLKIIRTPLLPASELESIPLNGKTTRFYYDRGPAKGHVKGSAKIWETLLLSLISFDFFVGTDKVYADTQAYGNPFYTSLKPWNRKRSDMWNFTRFLEFWGWRL